MTVPVRRWQNLLRKFARCKSGSFRLFPLHTLQHSSTEISLQYLISFFINLHPNTWTSIIIPLLSTRTEALRLSLASHFYQLTQEHFHSHHHLPLHQLASQQIDPLHHQQVLPSKTTLIINSSHHHLTLDQLTPQHSDSHHRRLNNDTTPLLSTP